MWEVDYGLAPDPEEEILESPGWQAQIEYADNTSQKIASCQGYLDARPEELYFALLDYF